jgi:hypothetical protein
MFTVDIGITWVCNYLHKMLVLITSIVYAQKSFTINNRKQHVSRKSKLSSISTNNVPAWL